MSSWCRLDRSSFLQFLTFFFVFINPKFMSCFIELQMSNIIMGVIRAHTWHNVRQMFSILKEKMFITLISCLCFKISQILFDLLFSGLKIVTSWSGSMPILLLCCDQIKIAIFTQTLIKFMKVAFFEVYTLIPWISCCMFGRRWNSFHYFNVVIHIKTAPSYVVLDSGCS